MLYVDVARTALISLVHDGNAVAIHGLVSEYGAALTSQSIAFGVDDTMQDFNNKITMKKNNNIFFCIDFFYYAACSLTVS